jgi:hypothetical protein
MPKRTLAVLFALASLTVVSSASAEDKDVKTMKPIIIIGRPARPSVTVEVNRVKPEIKLADLQDPKVEQIMRAAAKAPF